MEHLRTDFKFDQTPWKIVICEKSGRDCELFDHGERSDIWILDLPQAPEPGRIPEGTDHVHIVPKGSGDRDAREQEKWRSLVFSATRCKHGRMMGDTCKGCKGFAPDVSGAPIGYTTRGVQVRIPERSEMNDIRKWTEE